MNVELFRRFVKLTRDRREAEGNLDAVLEELRPLEALVIQELATAGVQNLKVEVGGKLATVYARTMMHVRFKPGADREQVTEALRSEPDCAEMVQETYNANKLSAWVRERLGEVKQPLPPKLDALVETVDVVSAHVTEGDAEPQSKSARARRAVASNSPTPTTQEG